MQAHARWPQSHNTYSFTAIWVTMSMHWQNELQSVGVNKSEGVNTKLTANRTQNQQCTKKKKFCGIFCVTHEVCFISFRSVAFDLFSRPIWKHVSLQTFDIKYETLHLTVQLKLQSNCTWRRRRRRSRRRQHHYYAIQCTAYRWSQICCYGSQNSRRVFSKILTGQYY